MADDLAGSVASERAWSARLGAHLEAARRRAGMRRIDLAARAGVSEETVRLWERGAVQPSPELLARVIPAMALEGATWSAPPTRGDDEVDELPPLARRLRHERDGRGLTQVDLACELGVAPATYVGWETGRSAPGRQHAGRLAALLGIPESEALELIGVPVVVQRTAWPPFGQLLGARREALHLTRSALAERLATTPRTIMSWELGYRRPPAKQLPALAAALDVDVETLLGALPSRSAPSRLGELIVKRQQALGLHSADVARMVGTTEPTISRWINGHSRPAGRNLDRLASVLRVPRQHLAEVAGSPA